MLPRLHLQGAFAPQWNPSAVHTGLRHRFDRPACRVRTPTARAFSTRSNLPALGSPRPLCAATELSLRKLHTTTAHANIQPQATSVPHASIAAELAHPISPPPAAAGPDILDRVLPDWAKGAKPYLQLIRIDKPIGSVLLFWPCAWSITMASTLNHLPPSTPLFYLALFGTGAIVMRGAGCTINDMWDRKYDAAVERTKSRPLAAGTVTPFNALTFLGGQLAVGLAVLTQLNYYSIALGASSLGLVVLYPLMKRITYYPQIVMGLTFNWGALLGWSAVAGAVDWTIALPMYVTGTIWGVVYDTIYAHQDKVDDVSAGVKSMALRFPDSSRTVISVLSSTVVAGLGYVGYAAGLGPAYYAVSVLGAAGHLAWQCKTVDFDSRADCWSKFKANGWLGGLIWLGIALDYVVEVVVPGKYKNEDVGEGEMALVEGQGSVRAA